MARGKKVEPPDWFQLEVYKAPRNFDAHQWLEALRVRAVARYVWERVAQQEKEFPVFSRYLDRTRHWEMYLDDAFPWMQEGVDTHAAYDDPSSYWHVPSSVEEAREGAVDRALDEREKLLVIDLNAPDTTIIEEVKRWLVQARMDFPLPVKRRGRKAANLEMAFRAAADAGHYVLEAQNERESC